jgi:hypothetical protein
VFASRKGWFVSRCSIHDFDLRALVIATKGRWIVLGARLECGPFFRSFSFFRSYFRQDLFFTSKNKWLRNAQANTLFISHSLFPIRSTKGVTFEFPYNRSLNLIDPINWVISGSRPRGYEEESNPTPLWFEPTLDAVMTRIFFNYTINRAHAVMIRITSMPIWARAL